MVKIANHAEHDFDFNRSKEDPNTHIVALLTTLTFERAGIRDVSEMVNGVKETKRAMAPGVLEVSDEDYKAMLAHPVAQHWFKSTSDGKPQLLVVGQTPDKAPMNPPKERRAA